MGEENRRPRVLALGNAFQGRGPLIVAIILRCQDFGQRQPHGFDVAAAQTVKLLGQDALPAAHAQAFVIVIYTQSQIPI